ncbi:tetratricopeptide repeat protein [Phenylobacterium sp. 20VBR1]|uniref:Tetratricopeptide repeat protein 38 n=1 Tax=Phenylobacterium glaciei TaxID=2803784 RepID=A0A941D546_9CAUL|nr:tetratricopeptide repeat protein [Phenylobacterium glaciei]MBR7620968.1 tetratricopeptide repeat protein [Phenylobacterium glaciei]
MPETDAAGLTLTGASPQAAADYRQAVSLYHGLYGAPLTLLEQAIADSPGFVMAHVLKADMLLVGTSPEVIAMGGAAVDAARDLTGTERERGHVAAAVQMAAGQFTAAGRILEDVSIAHPLDGVALQAGQLMDFMLGDNRMLRDRIARALPAWSPQMPDYHAVLGMHAFGLEETGFYARAEAAGREAIDLQPRNAWAQHAVAHVFEMQDRRADGVAWMRTENAAWQHDSLFGVHNWWHLALFHLGLGETDEVLALYDGPIAGDGSDMAFDLLDAAALLWRLKLEGAATQDRFAKLADAYERKAGYGLSAFDDVHAMMAFVGAGREAAARDLMTALEAAATGQGDNAIMTAAVGLPVARALQAFGQGRFTQASDDLRAVRNHAHRFGGSHAQRDVIDLTLIAAARAAGETSLERALLAERAAARP